jgi:uncharacterized protein
MFEVGQVDVLLMFVLGLTSSLHCTTMCGPLIAVASAPVGLGSGGGRFRPKRLLWHQSAYHLGRAATYAVLGGMLALLGSSVTLIPRAKLVGGIVQLTIGSGIALAGAWQLLKKRRAISCSDGWLSRALRAVMTGGHAKGMLGMGLLTGFLPCGVLYVALSRATVAGSAWGGMAVMAAFWLGTVPLLAGLGMASGGLIRLGGKYITHLLFFSMVVTGGWVSHKGIRNIVAVEAPAQGKSGEAGDCPCRKGRHQGGTTTP